MLVASRFLLRPRTVRRASGGIGQLKRRLKALRASNETAQATLAERRRRLAQSLRFGAGGDPHHAGPTHGNTDDFDTLHRSALELLPRNPSLEASIAFVLHENKDARAELEFTRQLLNSTLLSLASPVSQVWDPYDVKPQVFALDNYLALPVFTSVEYLALFCRKFGFIVRDPSGTLWADGPASERAASASEGGEPIPLLPDLSALEQSEWWRSVTAVPPPATADGIDSGKADTAARRGDAPAASPAHTEGEEAADYVSADALFEDMMRVDAALHNEKEVANTAATKGTPKRRKKRRRHTSARLRLKRLATRASRAARDAATASTRTTTNANADPEMDADARARREVFMTRVAQVTPFGIRQATPLAAFGPPVRPYFVGYFADINTLLHNAAIVPDKVDIVVNPASPIEFVLAREATNRVLHKEQLLLHAYQRVERELQHEFSLFFANYCPGVRAARSACVPRPIDYEVAVEALRQARQDDSDEDDTGRGRENALSRHRERTRLIRESEFSNGVVYELVILLDCEDAQDLADTYQCLQEGKRRCLIMGHADLDVIPEAAAAPAVQAAAKPFYQRRTASNDDAGITHNLASTDHLGASGVSAAPHATSGEMGLFRVAGQRQTVHASESAESYFHDPTNAYTEAHAVFTEEMKLTRSR